MKPIDIQSILKELEKDPALPTSEAVKLEQARLKISMGEQADSGPYKPLQTEKDLEMERLAISTGEVPMAMGHIPRDKTEYPVPNAEYSWWDFIKSAMAYGVGYPEGAVNEPPRKRPPPGEMWWQQDPRGLIEEPDEIAAYYFDPLLDENGKQVINDYGEPQWKYSTRTPRGMLGYGEERMQRLMEPESESPTGILPRPGMAGSATDMILGRYLGNLDQTVKHIMHGDDKMRLEAFMGLVGDIAWLVPESLGGLFSWVTKDAIRATLSQGGRIPVTDKMVNEALKRTLPGPGELETIKREFSSKTPRQLIKFLDKILPEAFKPRVIKQNIWENFTVPLAETLRIPFEKRIMPTFIFGEKDIPWKSLAEVWQPAIERARKAGMGAELTYSRAKEQLVTGAGEELGRNIFREPLRTQKDIALELQGIPTKNPVAKEHKKAFYADLGRAGMKWDYYKNLNKYLDKNIKSLGREALNDPIIMGKVDQALGDIDRVMAEGPGFNPKKLHKALKQYMQDPDIPDTVRSVLFDIHELSFNVPAKIAEASRRASTSWMVRALRKRPDVVSMVKKPGMVQSNFPGLKDLWVNRDVELELRTMKAIPKMSNHMYNKIFMSPWKTSKVIMSPATHFRNLMSNMILNDWGGLPFYRLDYYVRAAKGLPHGKFKGAGGWQDYARATGGGGMFSSNEVMRLTEHLQYSHNPMDTFWNMFYNNWYTGHLRNAYNAEEQLFKYAKFLWNRDHGMNIDEAALDAMKWTFNYGEITRTVAAIRTYAAPFFTWQSKVLPLMAETAVKHPIRFAKWPMFLWGMQQAGMMAQDITDDEWRAIEGILPDYIKEAQFGLMPWRDARGRLQLLNFTYIMPGLGDIADMYMDPAGYALGTPLVSLGGALLSKTRFSGAPLYYEWEEPQNKALKALSYIYQNLMPNMALVPWGVKYDKMMEAIRDNPDALTFNQILASEMGFKITPLDTRKLRRQKIAVDAIQRSEVARELDKVLRGHPTESQRREALRKFRQSTQRLNRKLRNQEEKWEPAISGKWWLPEF